MSWPPTDQELSRSFSTPQSGSHRLQLTKAFIRDLIDRTRSLSGRRADPPSPKFNQPRPSAWVKRIGNCRWLRNYAIKNVLEEGGNRLIAARKTHFRFHVSQKTFSLFALNWWQVAHPAPAAALPDLPSQPSSALQALPESLSLPQLA